MSAPAARAIPEQLAAYQAIKRGASAEIIRSVSGADFIAELRVADMVADPLIPAGALYSITGKTGHAKTAIMTAFELAWTFGGRLGGVECREVHATFFMRGLQSLDYRQRC